MDLLNWWKLNAKHYFNIANLTNKNTFYIVVFDFLQQVDRIQENSQRKVRYMKYIGCLFYNLKVCMILSVCIVGNSWNAKVMLNQIQVGVLKTKVV
jgi:hypothetical protein